MITNELVTHVKKELALGKSTLEIRQTLLAQGDWAPSDIDEVFKTAAKTPSNKGKIVVGIFISLLLAVLSQYSPILLYFIVPNIAYLFGFYPLTGLLVPIILFPTLNSLLLFILRKTSLRKGILWGYMFFAVLGIFFAFSYALVIKSQNEIIKMVKDATENARLGNEAFSTGDSSVCANVQEGQYMQGAKASCYKKAALKSNDLAICDLIKGGLEGLNTAEDCKDAIYYGRALDNNDISQCEQIISINTRKFCVTDDRLTGSDIYTTSGSVGLKVILKLNGVEQPVSVVYGSTATLSWSSSNTKTCKMSSALVTSTNGYYNLPYFPNLPPSGEKQVEIVSQDGYQPEFEAWISCEGTAKYTSGDFDKITVPVSHN